MSLLPVDKVPILLPMPLDGTYDYKVPNDISLTPGSLVRVPLGKRTVIGIVWSHPVGSSKEVAPERLKAIDTILPLPPLSKDLIDFVDFVANYSMARPGLVLRMVLSSREALEDAPTQSYVQDGDETAPLKITPQRQKVIEAVSASNPLTAPVLAKKAGVSDGVVRAMIKAGRLSTFEESVDAPFLKPDPDYHSPELSDEQETAAAQFTAALRQQNFHPFLLDGITGSGKTEVYYEAIAEALRLDTTAQILVLLPEIGLTNQWLGRFEARFGVPPAQWHSDIGLAERRRVWRATLEGGAQIIVGARSALFLPFQNLKLIIVDEEHDPSYKQEDGTIYNGRDMAVMRGLKAEIPVILATATPSLESHVNAQTGRYTRVELKARYGAAKLPVIHPIDMRQAGLDASHWISPTLKNEIGATLEKGEQTLLFLNRRGYAPLTLCRSCGHRYGCPDCSAWLVEHRFRGELMCHQCGYTTPKPSECVSCKEEDSFAACGPGVERLSEEVLNLFPDARMAVLTSDTPGGIKTMRQTIDALEAGDIDIVIGTQLITKGYHFPNLTLVGVVDADLGLRGGDLRAGERTYQQLVQVAGRAGRAAKKGQVMLQTYEPEHPVVSALISGDRDAFLEAERRDRELTHMPPYGRLAALIISSDDDHLAMDMARRMAARQPADSNFRLFGPATAPIARIRGQFRVRFLVQAMGSKLPASYVRQWLADCYRAIPNLKKLRIKVDIDPQSFH